MTEGRYLNGATSGTTMLKQGYNYDQYGNRTIDAGRTWGGVNNVQLTIDGGTNRAYAWNDPSHQLLSYDGAGNVVNDSYTSAGSTSGAWTRGYDAENRLVSAPDYTGQTSRYTYDAEGWRVRRNLDSLDTSQVYELDGELRPGDSGW